MKYRSFSILLANGTENLLRDMFQIDTLRDINFRSNTKHLYTMLRTGYKCLVVSLLI